MEKGKFIANLPDEVIIKILENEEISVGDAVNFISTCKQFQFLTDCRKLWRTKFYQRWPSVKSAFRYFKNEEPNTDWPGEVQTNVSIEMQLLQSVKELSSRLFHNGLLLPDVMTELKTLWDSTRVIPRLPVMIDTLTLFYNDERNSNLTHKYYAMKVLWFLKQEYLKFTWQSFSIESGSLEGAAIFLAEWCQPDKLDLEQQVSLMLDEIANQVKKVLRVRNPLHPIFKGNFDRRKNLSKNQLNTFHTKEILDCQFKVMFESLDYRVVEPSGSGDDLKSCFINEVLRHKIGNQLIILIIFESVAKRLGVHCTLTGDDATRQIVVCLSESNKDLNLSFEDNPPTEFKAPKLNLIECQHPYNRSLPNIQLIEEMAHYVKNVHGVNDDTVQAALEICLLMNPDNLDHMENLLNYTIKVNSDVSYVLGRLQDIAENTTDLDTLRRVDDMIQLATPTQDIFLEYVVPDNVKPRNCDKSLKDLIFPVGVLVFYKDFLGNCLYGIVLDRHNIQIDRTMYKILIDGEVHCSCEQENLCLALPDEVKQVENSEIGRYFKHFKGLWYEPNEEMTRKFPQDAEVRKMIMAQFNLEESD